MKWLKKTGNMKDHEFAQTFNTGLGMVLVVEESNAAEVIRVLSTQGQSEHQEKVFEIGRLVDRPGQSEGTILTGLQAWSAL